MRRLIRRIPNLDLMLIVGGAWLLAGAWLYFLPIAGICERKPPFKITGSTEGGVSPASTEPTPTPDSSIVGGVDG